MVFTVSGRPELHYVTAPRLREVLDTDGFTWITTGDAIGRYLSGYDIGAVVDADARSWIVSVVDGEVVAGFLLEDADGELLLCVAEEEGLGPCPREVCRDPRQRCRSAPEDRKWFGNSTPAPPRSTGERRRPGQSAPNPVPVVGPDADGTKFGCYDHENKLAFTLGLVVELLAANNLPRAARVLDAASTSYTDLLDAVNRIVSVGVQYRWYRDRVDGDTTIFVACAHDDPDAVAYTETDIPTETDRTG
jgi:hypothetical protein